MGVDEFANKAKEKGLPYRCAQILMNNDSIVKKQSKC